MSYDATKEIYEYIELFGNPALFSNLRIDKNTVPTGMYCYDLRGSSEDVGNPISLENSVHINHAGCILLPEKLDIPKDGYINIEKKINFLGEELSIEDFCTRHGLTCSDMNVQQNNPAKDKSVLAKLSDNKEKVQENKSEHTNTQKRTNEVIE